VVSFPAASGVALKEHHQVGIFEELDVSFPAYSGVALKGGE
jgi:hypothetical protein